MGSSTSAVTIIWNSIISKIPSFAVLLTVSFIYYMYMETFLVPLFGLQNQIPLGSKMGFPMSGTMSHFNWNRSWIYMIVVHYFAFWFLISLLRVVFTDPGFVPAEWNKRVTDQVVGEYIEEQKTTSTGLFTNLITKKTVENFNFLDEGFKGFLKKKNQRFCIVCKNFKPERTHHCRQTGKCVLKMDHYCNWISSCIGFQNYKFFLTFILYTSRAVFTKL